MMEICAKDIMSREIIVGHPDMTVEEAIKILFNNGITGMPVVDKKRRMVGAISQYDIIKSVNHKGDAVDLRQRINYSEKTGTIKENTALNEILRRFSAKKIHRLPVVNKKNELVGIITQRDIVRLLFYRSQL